jgi:membrane-associated phospholipid phosphatase
MRVDLGMSEEALKSFSALGDPFFMLLCAAVVFLQIWKWNREVAYGWVLVVALAVALTVAGKTVFYLLALEGRGAWQLHSPSGHMSIAAVVYGGCGSLLAAGRPRAVKIVIAIAVAGMLVGLGLSRVLLGLHSVLEVVVGLLFGLVCVAGRRFLSPWCGIPKADVTSLLTLLILLHFARFAHVDGEALVARLARGIQHVLAANS